MRASGPSEPSRRWRPWLPPRRRFRQPAHWTTARAHRNATFLHRSGATGFQAARAPAAASSRRSLERFSKLISTNSNPTSQR